MRDSLSINEGERIGGMLLLVNDKTNQIKELVIRMKQVKYSFQNHDEVSNVVVDFRQCRLFFIIDHWSKNE